MTLLWIVFQAYKFSRSSCSNRCWYGKKKKINTIRCYLQSKKVLSEFYKNLLLIQKLLGNTYRTVRLLSHFLRQPKKAYPLGLNVLKTMFPQDNVVLMNLFWRREEDKGKRARNFEDLGYFPCVFMLALKALTGNPMLFLGGQGIENLQGLLSCLSNSTKYFT
jgi:hypothetical protein